MRKPITSLLGAFFVLSFCLLACWEIASAAPNEVKVSELAPGVFFRKAQTEPVFTGCNQGWVVFKDFVLIIDANFPGQADEVLKAIRATTDKPIRFVFDTHYHGDHADGNMQYKKIGATIIAQERSQPLFQTKGLEGFTRAQTDRKDEYGALSYELPSLYFSHKLIFDDGEQRVELIFMGHAHTAGDAVAWLPRQKILFTGDACVNGAFNYTGDSQTESWISALAGMQELEPTIVGPGHGEPGGPEVLANQKRYFQELRSVVQKMVDEKRTLDQIKQTIELPFFQQWAGVDIKTRVENIEHVYKELTAGQKDLQGDKDFGQWQGLPDGDNYAAIGPWDQLGSHPFDLRMDALADLYLDSDSTRRRLLRDHFNGQTDTMRAMVQYVRRTAARMESQNDSLLLRRGLAIAAIEGGRVDPQNSLASLAVLRHGAERQTLIPDDYFRQIQESVSTENRPLFETARTLDAEKMKLVVQDHGPVSWRP